MNFFGEELFFVELDAIGEISHHVSEEVEGIATFWLVLSTNDDLDQVREETPVLLGTVLGSIEDDRGHLHGLVTLIDEVWGDRLQDNWEHQILEFQEMLSVSFYRFDDSFDCHNT